MNTDPIICRVCHEDKMDGPGVPSRSSSLPGLQVNAKQESYAATKGPGRPRKEALDRNIDRGPTYHRRRTSAIMVGMELGDAG